MAWGRERMGALGFERVRAEPVTVPVWVRGPLEEAVVFVGMGESVAPESIRVTALGGSPPTPFEGVAGEVVEITSFEQLRALGDGARGKILFFNRPMDPNDPEPFHAYGTAVDQRSRGGVEAKNAGAVGALVRSITTKRDDSPHTGAMQPFLPDGKTRAVPTAAVSTLGAERLQGFLASGQGPVRVRLRLSCSFEKDRESANVVGEIVGFEKPNEIVLVGAHLDAWETGDGAHDDGAGCAQVIEALRLIRAAGLRPRRTIRGVLFMNEENGLAGGKAYFQAHKNESHLFAVETDSGGFAPRALTAPADSPIFATVSETAARLRCLGPIAVRAGGGGADLSPLQASGVACGQLVVDGSHYFDFHHSENDVLSAVDPWDLESGAAALACVLWAVADR